MSTKDRSHKLPSDSQPSSVPFMCSCFPWFRLPVVSLPEQSVHSSSKNVPPEEKKILNYNYVTPIYQQSHTPMYICTFCVTVSLQKTKC